MDDLRRKRGSKNIGKKKYIRNLLLLFTSTMSQILVGIEPELIVQSSLK